MKTYQIYHQGPTVVHKYNYCTIPVSYTHLLKITFGNPTDMISIKIFVNNLEKKRFAGKHIVHLITYLIVLVRNPFGTSD